VNKGTTSKGIRILEFNKWATLPVLCLALLGVVLSGVNVVALLGSVCGGVVLAFLVFKSWYSGGSWWLGGVVGLWTGVAVGGPFIIFPSDNVAPWSQMLVSWLWVLVGVSGTWLLFKRRFLAGLKGGI
jgi:hypothetical protein